MRRLLLVAGALLTAPAFATIPSAAMSDPLYQKGYLVAYPYYSGVYNDGTHTATTTTGLQTAIDDARDNLLVLYLPAGTYTVNGTLQFHTQTVSAPGVVSKPCVLVGSTLGARPVIKLAANTFTNASSPQVIVDFRNYDDANPSVEKPNAGYGQMIRGVDINCNNNAGAIGLYFNQAQESSIENVKITATNAVAGIQGLPARAWGGVNIEVVGGQYGIDTSTTISGGANIGSVIAGVRLTNQTVSAIRHPGQALTIVGFEITTPSGSTIPGVSVHPDGTTANAAAHAGCLDLIDGTITLGSTSAIAINNPWERNIYVRNVYVTGSGNLVKSGSNATITGTGTWKAIAEYAYANQNTAAVVEKESWDVIDGTADRKPPTLNNGEVRTITSGLSSAPSDLITRHIWSALPSVDDPDYVDASTLGITPGVVSASTLQTALNTKRKIFLPPGTYSLTGTVTLNSDNILFGAARHLSLIEVASSWQTTAEVPVITTANDATATTYLGDITIGVPTDKNSDGTSRDYFTALDWQAGGNSMVHMGRPYHNPQGSFISGYPDTNAHHLMKIRNSGGGRWYFLARGEARAMGHPDYRVLNVSGTTQPLWIYGLNPEHVRADYAVQFTSAANIRIYSIKTEYHGEFGNGTPDYNVTFLGFNNATNVAAYGHTAVRHSPSTGHSVIEFKGTTPPASSGGLLAATIIPQTASGTGGYVLHEVYTSPATDVKLNYPSGSAPSPAGGLSLYRRGTISASDEAKMVHADIGYGPLPAIWSDQDIGAVGKTGSAFYGNGTFTINSAGADIFASPDEFHFVYQFLSGNKTMTARVATQENTATFAKAGVMFRAGLGADSRFVNVHVTPANGTRLHYRTVAGGSVTSITGPSLSAPAWVRITRSGDNFTGYASADGVSWTTIGTITIPSTPTSCYIGLINCSVDDAVLNTSTFDHVTLP